MKKIVLATVLLSLLVAGEAFTRQPFTPVVSVMKGDWYSIPLTNERPWIRFQEGTISLSDIDSIEIIFYNIPPCSIWLDGMVLGGREVTENNASEWGIASPSTYPIMTVGGNDTLQFKSGTSSIRIDGPRGTGGYEGAKYPGNGNANLDLSTTPSLAFWLRIHLDAQVGMYDTISMREVKLKNSSGAYFSYVYNYAYNFNFPPDQWYYLVIPLQELNISFSATPQNSRQAPLNSTFSFGATPSQLVSEYRLDINGDGIWERRQSTGGSMSWTFDTAGMYEATLEVTDITGYIWSRHFMVTVGVTTERSIKPKVLEIIYNTTNTLTTPSGQFEAQRSRLLGWSNNSLDVQFAGRINYSTAPPAYPETGYVDGRKLISQNQLDARVKRGEVDEVWVFGHHVSTANFNDMGCMAGPGAFWAQGETFPDVDSGKPFHIWWAGFSDVGFHEWSHYTEAMIGRVFRPYSYYYEAIYLDEPWSDFTRHYNRIDYTGIAGVGTVHNPPNTSYNEGYQYGSYRFVDSTADDWLDFPYRTGKTRLINYTEWAQEGYLSWWHRHFPKAPGMYGTRQNNWWKYVFDYNAHGESMGMAALPQAHITTPVTGYSKTLTFRGHGHSFHNTSNIGQNRVAKLIWNFGDGTPQVVETQHVTLTDPSIVTHTFPSGGKFTVTLVAEDALGRKSSSISTETVVVEPIVPDLTMTIYGDTNGWYGQTRNQRVLLVNQGTLTSPQTTLNLYLSYDDKYDTGDTQIRSYQVPSLAPSGTVRIDYTVTLPTTWPQRMVYVLAVVDPTNAIEEADETNNTKFRTIGYGKMPYDVDGSGQVTIADVNLVLEAYYTEPNDTNDLKRNASADVDRDGMVRITDVNTVTNHYFEVDSQVELHASASPTTVTVGSSVLFSYETHYFYGSVAVLIDYDGNGTWDFNSGAIANEVKGSKSFTYNTRGTYTAKVLGWDSNWKTESATITITVQ